MTAKVPFDDETLTELAQQVYQEYLACTTIPAPTDEEMQVWVKEISNENQNDYDKPTNISKGPTKRMAAMPSVGRSFGMSGGSINRSSNLGRANFSNRSVQAKPTGPDEFDKALPLQQASVWRAVVKKDEKRIQNYKQQPLSLAYRGKTATVNALNEKQAARLATEHATAAAKQVGLSEEIIKAVEGCASKSGKLYLEEIKKLLKDRLKQENDIDANKYPMIDKFLNH